MDKDRDSALPLIGFLYEKQENDSKEVSDDVESLDSVSKPLQGEKLTLKNDDNASPNETKPPNITQANDGLDKSNNVQPSKSPFLLLFTEQKLATLEEKEKMKPNFAFDSNKEVDNLNTALSNTTIAAPDQPNIFPPPHKYVRRADASGDESVNITDTDMDLNKINGVQENGSSFVQSLKKPINYFYKEIKISDLVLNNDTFTSGHKEKPKPIDVVDIKDLRKTNEDQERTSKPFSFVEELKKKPDKKKEKQAFHFSAPTQNSNQPSLKFSVSGINTPKFPKSNKDFTFSATDDSDGKEQSSISNVGKCLENVNTSKVFIFSDSKKDLSASSSSYPLKTDTLDRAAEECPNNSLKDNIKGRYLWFNLVARL